MVSCFHGLDGVWLSISIFSIICNKPSGKECFLNPCPLISCNSLMSLRYFTNLKYSYFIFKRCFFVVFPFPLSLNKSHAYTYAELGIFLPNHGLSPNQLTTIFSDFLVTAFDKTCLLYLECL